MLGLIVRILAYVALVSGLVIELGHYPYRNLSGGLMFGGAIVLLGLAMTRAIKTRGKMRPRE